MAIEVCGRRVGRVAERVAAVALTVERVVVVGLRAVDVGGVVSAVGDVGLGARARAAAAAQRAPGCRSPRALRAVGDRRAGDVRRARRLVQPGRRGVHGLQAAQAVDRRDDAASAAGRPGRGRWRRSVCAPSRYVLICTPERLLDRCRRSGHVDHAGGSR